MSSIIKVMPLLLVTQMKSSKQWIHSKKRSCVEWSPFVVVTLVMKEMMTTQFTLFSSSTNIDNTETYCTPYNGTCIASHVQLNASHCTTG